MQYLRVKNFDQFQHYKDRSPPWIKLHNSVLEDYDFSCLQDASKLHLVLIWLLASRLDNRIPKDPEWVARKINATEPVDLNQLIELGFLVMEKDASKPLANRLQRARPEGETEGETEGEKKGAQTLSPLPEWLELKSWEAWKKHRSEIRKPLKPSTVKAQWRKLDGYRAEGHAPTDVIEHSIAGGYTGLYPPDKRRSGNGAHQQRSLSAVERVERANGTGAFAKPDGATVDPDDEAVRPPMAERIR